MFYNELAGNALAAYVSGVDKIKSKCRGELGLSVDGVIVRPVRPEDMGSSYCFWVLNQVATNTFTDIVTTYTIADNRFILINGFYAGYSAQVAHQIRIQREGSYARYWPITPLRSFRNATGYADDPWTVDQNTVLSIAICCSSVSTTTGQFDFIGAVAEKRGILINP